MTRPKKPTNSTSQGLELSDASVNELIASQTALEKDTAPPDNQALQAPVAAEEHTPPYEMHRYYARRPHSVFRRIIQHYSRPSQIVLDPFCGGGVTVIEALRLRRRVIGVDFNPVAIMVTRMSTTPVPLAEFDRSFELLARNIAALLMDMYRTVCPKCGSRRAFAEWYEWSERVKCPHCHRLVILAKASKLRGSREYKCPLCKKTFSRIGLPRMGEVITRIKWRCPDCGEFGQKSPDRSDVQLARKYAEEFDSIVDREGLWYPQDRFPDGDRWRDDGLAEKGIETFADLYTRRNLLALARLLASIRRLPFQQQEELWFMTFSSALWRCTRTAYVKSDQRLVNHGHTYWIPDVSGEINVWDYFVKRRVTAVRRGLEYTAAEINGFSVSASSFDDLKQRATHLLLAQSADELPVPNNGVDVIITDPPYGGNVQYSELSNLWWVWMGKGLIDNSEEAIQTRNTDFVGAKTPQHYEEMLYRIFRECHRVLRPAGWMVLTFHNRDIGVWMTLHRAANRAGFQLPSSEEDRNRGMVYQAPISVYTTTLHQQATGAMLGDFILSFKRREKPVLVGDVLEQLSAEEEGLLRERTQQLIEFHGGADVNTLMTGLLPFLQERGLLHRLARFDFNGFFGKYFESRDGRWFTREMAGGGRPVDFIPAERLVEQVIVSLLQAEKIVTLDRVLVAIYTTLVNSQRPNVEVVHSVLDRICHEVKLPGQKGRKGFALRSGSARQGGVRVAQPTVVQTGLYGEGHVVGPLTHNEIIRRLVQRAHYLGYDVHVGETEQGKAADLAEASVPMVSNVHYGIPLEAFDSIKEIDLLILKGRAIQAAFEVATTIETANKAVNDRYRNLIASLPGFQLRCYLIVKDEHYEQAAKTLYTPANAVERLPERVRIVKTGSLSVERIDQLIDPTRGVASSP